MTLLSYQVLSNFEFTFKMLQKWLFWTIKMPQNEKLLHSNYCHSFQKCFYEPTWSEKKKSFWKWENINFLSWSHNEKMFHNFLVSKQVISVFFCHDNLLRISFCNLLAKKHANHFSRNFEPFEENVHHFYYTMVEKIQKLLWMTLIAGFCPKDCSL